MTTLSSTSILNFHLLFDAWGALQATGARDTRSIYRSRMGRHGEVAENIGTSWGSVTKFV